MSFLLFVGVAVVALVIGVAVGSIAIPSNETLTSTYTSTFFGTSTQTLIRAYTQTSFGTSTVVVTTTAETNVTITEAAAEEPIPIGDVETANVPVGGAPRTIAVNPNAGTIYVTDWFSNTLTVVNATSYSVIARILLPSSNNNGIAVDPGTNMVYVLVAGGVVEVNGNTDKVVGELPLNFGALAYNPVTHIIYGSSGNGSLVGADVQSGVVVSNITLGFSADSLAIDPQTSMIVAVGCKQEGLVCNSVTSIVNATSDKLVNQLNLGSGTYPRVAVDEKRGVAYVSGDQLVALNVTNGNVLYGVNPQECAPFDSMAVISSSSQVLAISLDYNYLMVYNGTSGVLTNMYSFSGTPQFVAYNPETNEVYVTTSGDLLAFQNVATTGHINSSLVGSGQNCPLP